MAQIPSYQQVWLQTRVEYVIIYKAFSIKLCYDKWLHIFFRLSTLAYAERGILFQPRFFTKPVGEYCKAYHLTKTPYEKTHLLKKAV